MKQVIDGKRYDTETAELIAEFDNAKPRGDFGRCEETLYRTAKGQFFLHGDGGAMTRWSQPSGDMRMGGEGILPLTEIEARTWCEDRRVDADVIAQYFSVEDA